MVVQLQALRQVILKEASLLSLEQLQMLQRRRRQLVDAIADFTPVSIAEYSRLSGEERQADDAARRIAYILSREIEYWLLRGELPRPILDWIQHHCEWLSESNALGTIGSAVGYYLEHKPQVQAVARRFQAGLLFSRSGADYPKLGSRWIELPPEQLFLRRESFPETIDHLVTLSRQGIDGAAGDLQSVLSDSLAPVVSDTNVVEQLAFPPSGDARGHFSEEAQQQTDEVDCTVFAPSRAQLGQCIMVQVFAHSPPLADQARQIALEFDDDAARRGVTSLATRVRHGSKLTFDLQMNGARVFDNVRSITWHGRICAVQFAVNLPAEADSDKLIGRLLVAQDTVPIGIIVFNVTLQKHAAVSSDRPTAAGEPLRFQSAFISYASKDRPEVLRRVQMLDALGIRYFHDLLSLAPGQRWKQELYRQIDHNDVLLLFWSKWAKQSKWVTKEWKYALARKGDGGVLPVVIEGPPMVSPPAELQHLHFCSRFGYFLAQTNSEES